MINYIHNKINVILLSLFVMLSGMTLGACSEDEQISEDAYGYVQFKLYKTASYTPDNAAEKKMASRSSSIDKLVDAQKVEVELRYGNKSIVTTLVLNSISAEAAEYGMRSDKLQLLAGDYRLVGFKVLNGHDEFLTGVSVPEDQQSFQIIPSGLVVKDLLLDVAERGMVKFKLVKDLPSSRASSRSEYLFEDIRLIDVTVQNVVTYQTTKIKNFKVRYKEEYTKDSVSVDNVYKDHGVAYCDSVVWLPSGKYKVSAYTVYSKKGGSVSELETNTTYKPKEFEIKDNQLTEYAEVPIKISETSERIKDYLALKEIWEKLDGKNWSFFGEMYPAGANWNFNKEIDMWGNQPGVTLNNQGRVSSISFSGFGPKGVVPDAIGQLTELKVLSLGSHDDKFGGHSFTSTDEASLKEARLDYKRRFFDTDVRDGLSELLQWSINNHTTQPKIQKMSRLQLKDIQIGIMTNGITGISKAIKRLTNLQQFYIANSPIKIEPGKCNFGEEWADPNSKYAQQYKNENLDWKNLISLTDVEIYNCPNLTSLPVDMLGNLSEIQLLNVACNKGISSDQLTSDWSSICDMPAGPKIQVLYMGFNNLTEFPESIHLERMVRLKLLDCTTNKIKTLHSFGTEIKLSNLKLDHNEIKEIPDDFCAFSEEVESLGFSHNKLKLVPDIFDASSRFIMGGVDFSNNQITGFVNGDNHRGINAGNVSLANNQLTKFPSPLFKAGSPISSLNVSNNKLTEIKKGEMKGSKAYMLQVIDLRFNKLKKLSTDFYSNNVPYLTGIDLSYNSFSDFPVEPLDGAYLTGFGIRHQRNDKGERVLKRWPEGITAARSLVQLQISSNDIRKVNETMTPYIYILDIKDNPNISIDLTSVCPYIAAGRYMLTYDKTQDIRGCDILDIQR